MPNWCNNVLSFRAEPEIIDEFLTRMQRAWTLHVDAPVPDYPFTLHGLRPRPTDLQARLSNQEEAPCVLPPGEPPKRLHDTLALRLHGMNEAKAYFKARGYRVERRKIHYLDDGTCAFLTRKEEGTDWYDWSIANWGTKWDVETEGTRNGNTLLFRFNSAWAPPNQELFESTLPEGMEYVLRFMEPGMNFRGQFSNIDASYEQSIPGPETDDDADDDEDEFDEEAWEAHHAVLYEWMEDNILPPS